MIRSLLILATFLCFNSPLSALDVSVTTATFRADGISYVEVYLQVIGKSVTFDTTLENGMQASVETAVIIRQGDSIMFAERFVLKSPLFAKINDFVEIRRYVLPDGQYEIAASFTDVLDETNQLEVVQSFDIEYEDGGLMQSDIRLLASIKKEDGQSDFHRNGYFLEPLPFNYYHRFNSTLIFYNEIYHTDTEIEEDFMITYRIKKQISAEHFDTIDFRHKRMNPMGVNVVLAKLDISALPSGNYLLEVEVKDRDQQVLSKRTAHFSRSNPVADVMMLERQEENEELTWLDTFSESRIIYAMKALEPTLAGQDVITLNYLIDHPGKLLYKKNFLYHIYTERYGELGEEGFIRYMEVADAINTMFKSGMGYGFETDRGRTYLKYGRPDERIRIEDDQGAYPYEIWYYNKIAETGQSDVRFMFYNPELATNHFLLLTSTCRGERQNPRWEYQLYRNSGQNPTDNIVDATAVRPGYRRRARELYEN